MPPPISTKPLAWSLGLALLAGPLAAAFNFTVILTEANGAAVADAVVSLTPVEPARPPPEPPEQPVIVAQAGQQYRPYVTPVLAGTTVEFPNRDDVQHHLYSVSPAKRFEKPLYASGASAKVIFDRPGVVTLGCNIHDWMVAHVVVLETPHFALTPDEGTATFSGLPAGRYQMAIWHPRLPRPLTREITLTADQHEAEELRLRPDRRLRRAPTPTRSGY